MLLCVICAGAQAHDSINDTEYLPQWQQGWMDIHTIATGKGDATFVIMPDGTTMLIDAGDMTGGRFKAPALPDDSRRPGEWIAKYILDFSKGLSHPERVDYLWLTHFHEDHMGSASALRPGPYYGICGIMEVGEYIRFNHIVDRAYPSYDYPSTEHMNRSCAKTLEDYIKFVNYQKENNDSHPERFEVGSRKQFSLQNNPKPYRKSFEVWNVACNLEVAKPSGRGTVKKYPESLEKIDENSLSGAIRVKYGNFTYFNGGDIGGSPADKRDLESDIADLIGQVTVMKANHHGWKDTCNPYFMWKTRPDVIIIPASHTNHPWKATVQRIYDPQMPGKRQMFATCDAAKEQVGPELWANVQPYFGHIVVRVYEGGKSYQIFVLDAYSKDYRVIYKSKIEQL